MPPRRSRWIDAADDGVEPLPEANTGVRERPSRPGRAPQPRDVRQRIAHAILAATCWFVFVSFWGAVLSTLYLFLRDLALEGS